MDSTDKNILAMLQENARIHNVEIGKNIGLTEGAVRARIERLLHEGTIRRFTIEMGEGGGSRAIIMVKAKGDTKAMMKEIRGLKLSQQAYEIASGNDACLIVDGSSLEDIDAKIDRIRELATVQDTQTFIVLKRW